MVRACIAVLFAAAAASACAPPDAAEGPAGPTGDASVRAPQFDAGRPCVPACATGDQCRDGVCYAASAGPQPDAEARRDVAVDSGPAVPDDVVCADGEAVCSGVCANTQTNADHCGACNYACMVPAGHHVTTAACSAGRCQFVCETGWADCDGIVLTGCEHNVQSDVEHCGACGNACPLTPRPNATPACVMGTCGIRCGRDVADCNGDVGDGCEVQLTTDAEHCGGCERRCGAGQRCNGGRCAM